MAKVVTFKIEGLDELERKLYDLPTKVARRTMREAMQPALEIWEREIAARAPKLTGWLAGHTWTKIKTSARQESALGEVGFSYKQDPSRLGTKKRGTAKQVPGAALEDFWVEFGSIHNVAQPFMRPAFESRKAEVLDKFTSLLREILNEVF
jgi:HK97 gp10 family phage protein